jgi:uncharacterized protein YdaL
MAVSLLDVIQQYFDNNGNLLAGGFVETYAAGTDTPLATYTDATGTIAHDNPVVLDAAGRPPGDGVWFTVGAAYKVILKDSSGVELESVDGITVGGVISTASQFVDVVMWYPGGPPGSAEALWAEKFTRAMTFSSNFSGAQGFAFTNPTSSFVASVRTNATTASNGTEVGTITYSTSGVATFLTAAGASIPCVAGDVLSIWGPSSADATMANFGATLPATLTT